MITKLQDGNVPCPTATSSEPCSTALVFDSGVGGLSIYGETRRFLPDPHHVHAFDSIAFSYGEKSEVFIIERVVEIVTAVQERYPLVLVVVVCSTTSIVSLPTLREKPDFPAAGVTPAIRSVARLTANSIAGLLATRGTAKRSYTHELITYFASKCQIEILDSTEMTELAEAELYDGDVSLDVLKRIPRSWSRMKGSSDTAVLECTHFPLLQEELLQALLGGTRLVDSSVATAHRTAQLLEHEIPDAKSADVNIAFCMAMTPEAEQLLSALQCYGFETLEKLAVSGRFG